MELYMNIQCQCGSSLFYALKVLFFLVLRERISPFQVKFLGSEHQCPAFCLTFGIADPSRRLGRWAISSVEERAPDNCVVVLVLLFDMESKRIVISRDVVFEEDKQWDWGNDYTEQINAELEWDDNHNVDHHIDAATEKGGNEENDAEDKNDLPNHDNVEE
ncbi:hypothetical protein LIER_43262 [Lithospermum erythrorhizon]|uniref:Retroviral polymerase SH3-like domain-containing protein n=1 Tax=Lithospermum erythrorhizon TaxID=34254 RepID=A0AAV3PW24_LITER